MRYDSQVTEEPPVIDTTTDLRKALIRATVNTVIRGASPMKAWLAERLLLTPFEMMSTAALEDLAREVIVDADVDALIETKSDRSFEDFGNRYMCGDCLDAGMIDTGLGWRRCLRCNPGMLLAESSSGPGF